MSGRRINPDKLLNSKWTATQPRERQRHFIVTRVHLPENDTGPIRLIDLQAVLTRRTWTLDWHELLDAECWLQGWQ
ncbi:MAG: TIGR02450 family Trp-rich protein [Pseudomonas oryzihabitans]